jgi:nucleoside-diphosphate-sugar epimerase
LENRLTDDLDHIIYYTRDLWNELRGERLFITGGTGFFGCWLLESFLWANERFKLKSRVTVLTRSPEAFRAKVPHLTGNKAVTILEGDVRTFEFPTGTFSYIIHAATETNTKFSPVGPGELFQANIKGTHRVLEFAAVCKACKFLFTSSGAIYGKQPAGVSHIPEEYNGAPETTDPNTAYGQSKRISEFLCTTAGISGLQTKIARCFAFVGPYLPMDSNYAIGNFIQDGLQGKSIIVNGDGTPYRSYLYASDLSIWLWTILFNGKHGRPYNVGSDADLTIAELAREVKKAIAPQLQIEIMKSPTPHQLAPRYVPSIQRVKTELGLNVQISLSESIKRTANFYPS